MQTQFIAPRYDTVFILSEDKSYLSRDEGTLKQDAVEYEVGTLVISEYNAGVKTGKFVRATQALVDAADLLAIEDFRKAPKFALVISSKDATTGDVKAPLFLRYGQVKAQELVLDVSITIAEATELLERQVIIVR